MVSIIVKIHSFREKSVALPCFGSFLCLFCNGDNALLRLLILNVIYEQIVCVADSSDKLFVKTLANAKKSYLKNNLIHIICCK